MLGKDSRHHTTGGHRLERESWWATTSPGDGHTRRSSSSSCGRRAQTRLEWLLLPCWDHEEKMDHGNWEGCIDKPLNVDISDSWISQYWFWLANFANKNDLYDRQQLRDGRTASIRSHATDHVTNHVIDDENWSQLSKLTTAVPHARVGNYFRNQRYICARAEWKSWKDESDDIWHGTDNDY